MTFRTAAAIAALSLAAAACSSSSGGRPGPPSAPTTMPVATTITTQPAGAGRLAVVDGPDLFTIAPDGSDRASAATGGVNTQPVWSPDGRRLAWAYAGDGEAGVAISDGPKIDLGALPFYLAWAPDGAEIAYLIPSQGAIEFGLVDAAGGQISGRDAGQPYYFSWAPDGTAMLRHVGNTLTQTGSAASPAELGEPAAFQAPSWVGDLQLFALADPSGDRLVLRHTGDGSLREIARLGGFTLFALSPDGSRVAWLDTGSGTPAVAAAHRAQSTGPALKIFDTETGTTVTLGAAVAFFWNRQGTRLLYLTAAAPGTLQWHVWSGSGSAVLDSFEPTGTLVRDYLPFFDQFAQSHHLWSPDGEAFVFAGTIEGKRGIWVRRLTDLSATWVASGEAAIWS